MSRKVSAVTTKTTTAKETILTVPTKNTGDLLRTLNGHGSSVRSVAFDSNNILASGSDDRIVRLGSKKELVSRLFNELESLDKFQNIALLELH